MKKKSILGKKRQKKTCKKNKSKKKKKPAATVNIPRVLEYSTRVTRQTLYSRHESLITKQKKTFDGLTC